MYKLYIIKCVLHLSGLPALEYLNTESTIYKELNKFDSLPAVIGGQLSGLEPAV